jgi:hypothetical protein
MHSLYTWFCGMLLAVSWFTLAHTIIILLFATNFIWVWACKVQWMQWTRRFWNRYAFKNKNTDKDNYKMAKTVQFHPLSTLKHQFMRSRLTLPFVLTYMALPGKYARYCKLL